MVSYNSINTFRTAIQNLVKKERNGYGSCKKDICHFFENKNFDDIWAMHHKVREVGNIKIIKLRIPNSFLNLSSADGFRLIICCNKNINTITFLNIYPKRGKLQLIDQDAQAYKLQLKAYSLELSASSLVIHDIQNLLTIISK